MHQAVDLGDWIAADHSNIFLLSHGAGNHAAQIRRILDVIVENGEVRHGAVGFEARADEKGAVGIVASNGAGGVFNGEGFSDNELVSGFAIFTHHAFIIGVGNLFRKDILDVAPLLGSVGGFMNSAYPLLLDRHSVDGGDLDRIGGQGPSRKRHKRDGGSSRSS